MKIKLIKNFDTDVPKLLAGFIAFSGLVGFLMTHDWQKSAWAIAVGLSQLLLIPEAINDERVQHLKLKAISVGFQVGLLAALLSYSFARHGVISVLVALDLVILVSSTALGLFYYWRWRDGREAKKADPGI